MPIFEKNGCRIYFAHIPKTGGTSLYLAFAASGWTILNLTEAQDPRSTFTALKTELGIEKIEMVGSRMGYTNSIQHAPYSIWKTWGPYAESFAIVRHPHRRLRSALAYHYDNVWEPQYKISAEEFMRRVFRSAARKPHKIATLLDGHLRRQSEFLGPSTRILRFEENWQQEICSRYGLKSEHLTHRNAGKGRSVPMTRLHELAALAYYSPDYLRFSYR